MRVNELSKQIGKSNKEVLEILQKNHFDVKSHSSKVTEDRQKRQMFPCRSKETDDSVKDRYRKGGKQIEWKI